MKLKNSTYDVLKWIVVIFLPALSTLLFSLGAVCGFNAEMACGIISAVTVFLGALIGVSTYTYNKGKAGD